MKRDTLDEMLAILTAGGRHNGERSAALPHHAYGNPALNARFDSEKGIGMRHMAKVVLEEEAFASREPIDKVLAIWADYMSLKDSSSPGGYSNDQDVKDFMRLGEAVDTMVNNLSRHQWWAIRKSRGICTQWIFKDAIYDDALTQAKAILIEKMREHVASARFFR